MNYNIPYILIVSDTALILSITCMFLVTFLLEVLKDIEVLDK